MNPTKRFGWGVGSGLAAGLLWTLAASTAAVAQPAPALPKPAQPTPAAPAAQPAPAAALPAPAAQPATAPAPQPAAPDTKPAKPDPIATALAREPGGLTLDEVAKLALKTKPSLRSKAAELKQAAAKVDQAFVNYFPRLSVAATYTRLSDVGSAFPFALVGVQNIDPNGSSLSGQLTIANVPCPTSAEPNKQCTIATDPTGKVGGLGGGAIPPTPLDTFSFTASLAVPVSDYLLRISQGHSAAQHGEKGKKIELDALTLTEAADAKVAYLNWVRAKGQAVVAREAVATANAHLEDVKRLKIVGYASQADVLRVEAQVASAEQGLVQVQAFESIAEEQVRVGLGLPKDKPLSLGIDVFNVAPPAALPQLSAAQDQALQKRLEIRALDETELSLKEVESVTRAGLYPRLDAFADLTVGNPNQRYAFAGAVTHTTWDAGIRASWTFNDTLSTIGAAAESKARVTQITEQKQVLRDGLKMEVVAAWAEIKKSAASIDAATRGLTASEEGLRVRRELFLQGKATNVEMLDAETEVTRARLVRLDAQIGLIVAQIKYDHAIGNDVGTQGTTASADKKSEAKDGDDASAKKVTNVASTTPPPLLPLAK